MELLLALQAGATVLTLKQRLSRELQRVYGEWRRAQGEESWRSPDVLTWDAWLRRTLEEVISQPEFVQIGAFPTVLNSSQTQALWEQVVEESPYADGVLRVPATTELAYQAWMLGQEWKLSLPVMGGHCTDDARAFSDWVRAYRSFCKRRNLHDHGQGVSALLSFWQSFGAPRLSLILLGFDEFTPVQKELMDTFRGAGGELSIANTDCFEVNAQRIALTDATVEIRAAAVWARDLLRRGERDIAVVAPDIGAARENILRIFDEVMAPATGLSGAMEPERPFHISQGKPLREYPVVDSALQILGIGRGMAPLNDIGSLLRSPFVAGADSELSSRALLDARLRARRAPEVSFEYLREEARARDSDDVPEAHACPILSDRLMAWERIAPAAYSKERPGIWSLHFQRLLSSMGWPGDRKVNSEEQQTLQAWQSLLDDFASLNAVCAPMTFAEALSKLGRMASARLFQPEAIHTPVQIMGISEVMGDTFNHLWWMGVHHDAWPAPPHPHPFLPIQMQRNHDLPHSSPERELRYARALTAGLLGSARNVVVSHPCREGDKVLRCSPLIAHLPTASTSLADEMAPVSLNSLIHESQSLERFEDSRAPEVESGILVGGGTRAVSLQATCPFRAFAELRLGAQPLDTPVIGLDAADRGRLVHRVLEGVWSRLDGLDELQQMDEIARGKLVRRCSADVVRRAAKKRPDIFSERFRRLEQDRLTELVCDWLSLEAERSGVRRVLTEQETELSIGGLSYQLRVDRIDELVDGRRLIIDYKTGVVSESGWFGMRPDDPQLPMYAMLQPDALAGLVFAQVRKGEMRFRGLVNDSHLVPGLRAFAETRQGQFIGSWQTQISSWREVLSSLGESFRQGDARVDPKHLTRSCQYCALASLCRVDECAGFMEDDEVVMGATDHD